MKRKLTKLELYGLLAILLGGAFYGYLTQVYDPAISALQGKRKEISAAQAEINRQRVVLAGAPAVQEKIGELEAAVAELEAALAAIQGTAKAAEDRAVTEAMDLIDQLATAENLTVKEMKFGRRILALGDRPAPPPQQRRRQREPEIVPTVTDRLGWQEYRLVYSGSHSAIVAFMEDLAQAMWLVRVNELRIEVTPPPRRENEPMFGEYEITLSLIL